MILNCGPDALYTVPHTHSYKRVWLYSCTHVRAKMASSFSFAMLYRNSTFTLIGLASGLFLW